jgi:hypothetical protein
MASNSLDASTLDTEGREARKLLPSQLRRYDRQMVQNTMLGIEQEGVLQKKGLE